MLEEAGVKSGCSPSMRQDAYNFKGRTSAHPRWVGW